MRERFCRQDRKLFFFTWPMMLATLGLLLYSSGLSPESWRALSIAMYAYLALPPMKRRVSAKIVLSIVITKTAIMEIVCGFASSQKEHGTCQA